ncbi:MAG TPA: alpha/beta hydrolase-fold protein [Bryobacteraceae bacterium]
MSPALRAQPTTGPQLATFHSDVDDSDQQYALYVPKSFDPGKKYPLVITLHEEDANHRLNLRRVFGVLNRSGETDTENMRYFPPVRDVDFLIAAPYARGTMGYRGIAERDVYDVLADVKRRFPVDEDRVYLTGISMGGGGALWLGLTRPDVWAAIAPVCPAAIPDAGELAGNALNLPIRLFHGDMDPVISVESSRAWHRRFLDLGVHAEYIEYPGVRHNAWDQAYRNESIFDWFQKFQRQRYPDRVRLATRSFRYRSAYWLRIDGLTPGVPASIDATWDGKTALKVVTQNVDGFTVSLQQVSAAPLVVTIDGTALRVKAAVSLPFTKTSAGWRQGRYTPLAKQPGAEGPIAEAVAGRHIYVYGTGGAPSADELAARRKVAETAAAWSTVRQRLALNLAVKADTAVTAADIDSSDLVLFGTAETNALIARFSAQLPLALSSAAADYGLLFIRPVGKHYALVNSGLPWWTGADEANRGGPPFAPPQDRLLRTFGDYIFFKGSLANVVAEGRFDRNWKVPPDAAAKILASGTATVR